MSYIVKGEDAPRTCYECDWRIGGFCSKTKDTITHPDMTFMKRIPTDIFFERRLPDCPLIDIPNQHGPLIEKPTEICYEGLRKIAPNDFKGIAEYFLSQIEKLPTIIEAEE